MRKSNLSNVRNHSNRCLCVLILIFLSMLSSCDRLKNLAGQSESAHVQQLEALTTRLNALENVVQQQISVLQQIHENVTPAEISPQWENRLEQLESQITSSNKWPKDAAGAEQYFEQTSDLVTGLPIWAEAQYLPRLSLVRWSAMAFNSLHFARDNSQSLDQLDQLVNEMRELANASPEGASEDLLHFARDNSQSLDQLDQLVNEMRELADASPEGASEDLVSRLHENAAEIEYKTNRQRVIIAVKAGEYVEKKDYIPAETSEIASLYEFLEFYEKNNEYADFIDVDVSVLRRKLYDKILIRQAVDQASSLRAKWKNVKEMAKNNSHIEVYEVAIRTLLQQVMSAQAALILEGIEIPDYNELEKELRTAVETIESQLEERQALAMRNYQNWALKKIKVFETAFEEIKKKADEEGSWWRRDNGGWIDYYKEVQDAMIKHLLPINVAMLDMPVQERYLQVFQTGWKKLDGREDQTAVAVASATIRKKPLRDFLKN